MHESLAIVKKRFEEDAFARSLGIVIDELTEGNVSMHMRLREDMLNLFGRPHGGVIYSLADAAFSVLGNNSNNLSVALDCSITYHASPEPGMVLIAEGEVIAAGRRTASFLFRVFADDDGTRQLVATMKSVLYRTGKPIASGEIC